ncbi:MAG TPA: hypothetical protein ENN19_12850 [Chloroflexi bacterium]|nr:hypothetical protein [Chloroflexota bacterium]
MGTFSASLTLAEDASLGVYAIVARSAGEAFERTFQVTAYRPPEFEAQVIPDAVEIQRGDDLSVTVRASYLFGGPLPNAPVRWNILAHPHRFTPPGRGQYSFHQARDPYTCFDCRWEGSYTSGQSIFSDSGQTDAEGNLAITLDADRLEQLLPYAGANRLTIEAQVTGPDNQVIASRGALVVHPGAYYVGLSPRQYVSQAGDPLGIDVVAVDWQGEPLPDRSIRLQMHHHRWENVYVETEHGGYWESVPSEEPVDEVTVTTDELEHAAAAFTPPEGGSYQIVAMPVEPTRRSREVRSSLFVWVMGEEPVSWRRENHERIPG